MLIFVETYDVIYNDKIKYEIKYHLIELWCLLYPNK